MELIFYSNILEFYPLPNLFKIFYTNIIAIFLMINKKYKNYRRENLNKWHDLIVIIHRSRKE